MEIKSALKNTKSKRRRVQNNVGEVLTTEELVGRLKNKEQRKKKKDKRPWKKSQRTRRWKKRYKVMSSSKVFKQIIFDSK